MKTIHHEEELRCLIDSDSGNVLVAFLGKVVDRDAEVELLSELEKTWNKTVRFYQVSPKAKSVWDDYRIRGTPVYLFFADGRLVDRLLGRLEKSEFEQIVRSAEKA